MRTPKPIISFFHECNPPTATVQQRRHLRSGKTYLPAKVKTAQAIMQAIFEKYRPGEPIAIPVELTIVWAWTGEDGFALSAKYPDLDNLEKGAIDAMTRAGYWKNDRQIVRKHSGKFLGPMSGISVTVEAAEL